MSKYYSKKVKTEYGVFDSKKEYKRYLELLSMQKSGLISDLQRQVRYCLIPSQKEDKRVVERPVYYVADFVYEENGKNVVEDTKGFKTSEYIIKRKLMLFIHGIKVKEI